MFFYFVHYLFMISCDDVLPLSRLTSSRQQSYRAEPNRAEPSRAEEEATPWQQPTGEEPVHRFTGSPVRFRSHQETVSLAELALALASELTAKLVGRQRNLEVEQVWYRTPTCGRRPNCQGSGSGSQWTQLVLHQRVTWSCQSESRSKLLYVPAGC